MARLNIKEIMSQLGNFLYGYNTKGLNSINTDHSTALTDQQYASYSNDTRTLGTSIAAATTPDKRTTIQNKANQNASLRQELDAKMRDLYDAQNAQLQEQSIMFSLTLTALGTVFLYIVFTKV